MPTRPISITIIAWLFIAAGIIGIAYHATEINLHDPEWVLFIIQLLAIVSGVLTLYGANWGRWLLLMWMFSHVYLNTFHPLPELIMHALLFAVVAFFLFRPKANEFFQSANKSAAV